MTDFSPDALEGLTAHERALLAATVGSVIAEQDEADLTASLRQLRRGLRTVSVELEQAISGEGRK